MYVIHVKDRQPEFFSCRHLVEQAAEVSDEQWAELEERGSVDIDTFLGSATLAFHEPDAVGLHMGRNE